MLSRLYNFYRIKPQCNLLFEVGHLSYSAPSTISRMGIVYVDPSNLGYMPFWVRWLEPRSLMEQTALDQCFQKYVPVLLNLIFEDGKDLNKLITLKTAVSQTRLNMVNNRYKILKRIITYKYVLLLIIKNGI